jgi:hypothetical protein
VVPDAVVDVVDDVVVILVVSAELEKLLDELEELVVELKEVVDFVEVVVPDVDPVPLDAVMLLYIFKRLEPPQYSSGFPKHVSTQPEVVGTLPAFTVFPQ